MQIEVSAETQERIESLVHSGQFRSVDDVLSEALDAWESTREQEHAIARMIADGVQAVRDGRVQEVTPDLAHQVIRAGVTRNEARTRRTG